MVETMQCQNCGAAIDFDPAEAGFGRTTTCAACGRSTPMVVRAVAPGRSKGSPPAILIIGTAALLLAGVAGAVRFCGGPAIGGIVLVVMILCGLVVYFIPAALAVARGKRNATAIIALNVFLGWSLIGWVVALVWALAEEK